MPRHFYRGGFQALAVPLRLSMGIFLLVLGSGCATNVQLGDPPQLFLEGGAHPTMEKITVTNGAGQTLYEGDPGQIEADPPLDQLDGTMTITQHWSDGQNRTFTVNHDPNSRVNVGWNSGAEKYEIQKPGPLQIGIAGGGGQMEGTRFGIGTLVKGGKEESLAKNDDTVNTTYVHSHLSYELGPKWKFSGSRFYVSGSYQFGESKDSAREPSGGGTVAVTYDKNASDGTTTGLGLGTNGAEARSENHMRGIDLRAGLTGDFILVDELTLSPNINLSYKGVWQNGWGDFRSMAFGDAVFSETEQDLDDHYYGLGTGAYLEKSCQHHGVSAFVGGELTGYWRETKLKSRQENRCTAVGCTAVHNETFKVKDDDAGFTYGVVGRAGVSFDLVQNWKIGAIGAVEYLQERGDVQNRDNPGETTKRVETNSALDWNLGVFLRKNF